MKLNEDQALQQAVEAHKEGKTQEAERGYKAILKSQPTHPEANHNLGVIVVGGGDVDSALPLFKNAIEKNPKIEQFWISHIDALIKLERFSDAKDLLNKGRNGGFIKDKGDALNQRIMLENKEKKPSEIEVNNLLQYYREGDDNAAENLALSITQEFPDHQLSWKVLGAVLKNKGEFLRSVKASQKAAEINPDDPECYNNMGNTQLRLGLYNEAEDSYKRAIAIKPDYHEFHNNLGYIYAASNRLNEAIISYKQAILLESDYSSAHYNLGATLKALGRSSEAEESYRKSILLEPKNPIYYTQLGLVLRDLGKYAEAEESYRKTIALDPEDKSAHYHLGIVLFEFRHYKEAAEHFQLTDIAHSKSFALKCSYLQGEKSIFYKQLDDMIGGGAVNPVIGSLSCRSEIRYGIKRTNPFCNDPLKYVFKTDLTEKYDFKNTFINEAKIILSDDTLSPKDQGLITNGFQTTGNLFHRKGVAIDKIESAIRSEIDKYRIHFKDSDEGLIKKWPVKYSLHGWLISMKSGGKLASHMHDNGWLSGSIYINVPLKSNSDSGNLVVCIDDEKFGTKESKNKKESKNRKESIDVVTGSLCLFPSSLLHHTIPFKSEEERIVLAFDVMPNQ